MKLSEILADAILSGSGDAIIAADTEGTIQFWNAGAERMFGYAGEEAMGRSLDIIIPERLRQRHWEGYRKVMNTGESRYGHGDVLAVPAINKDGAHLSVEFTILPLRGGAGELIGVAAIMRDVTKRFEEVRLLKQKLAEAGKVSPGARALPGGHRGLPRWFDSRGIC